MESLCCTGVWWLPSCPRNVLHGQLEFHPFQGAYLNTFGVFDACAGQTATQQEIVLGVCANGRLVTLVQVAGAPAATTLQYESQQTQPLFANMWSLRAQLVIMGRHLTDVEQLQFDRVRVLYSHLDKWVDIHGFRIVHSSNKKCTVYYNQPQPIGCKLYNDPLSFAFCLNKSSSNTQVQLQQTMFVRWQLTQERSWQQLQHKLLQLQNLLSFGANMPVQPQHIEALMLNCNQPVQLLYRLRGFPATHQAATIAAPLFTLQDIAQQLDMHLKCWFDKARLLQPVHMLYFALVFGPTLYAQNKFLHLVQALETYHSRTHAGAASLSKRLCEVLRNLTDVLAFKPGQMEPFIKQVVRTRNYLTHYSKSHEKQYADRQQLNELTRQLRDAVRAVLLQEAGFSKTAIKKMLSRMQSPFA
ncbi:MAG: HEPN domain-containing protein [Myxococcota bacterium]